MEGGGRCAEGEREGGRPGARRRGFYAPESSREAPPASRSGVRDLSGLESNNGETIFSAIIYLIISGILYCSMMAGIMGL